MKKAVFTIVHNERYFLPLWLNFYKQFFEPEEIYVLDDSTTDGSTNNLDVNLIKINNPQAFNHAFLLNQVKLFQIKLLKQCEVVLFSEVDEFVTTNPQLNINLTNYIDKMKERSIRCTGWSIVPHPSELPIDLNKRIMDQRKFGFIWEDSCKVLLSKVPLNWSYGFHSSFNLPKSKDLLMLHLHHFDPDIAKKRHYERVVRPPCRDNLGNHNKARHPQSYFDNKKFYKKLRQLPEYFVNIPL